MKPYLKQSGVKGVKVVIKGQNTAKRSRADGKRMATNPLLIRGPKSILFRNQRVYHKRHFTQHSFLTTGLVSRTICSTAIISLFSMHYKMSNFLCSLRTPESVESLNCDVRINARLDICPFRSMNQFDQLHLRLLPMWTTSGSGARRKSSGGIVLFSASFRFLVGPAYCTPDSL